jgi:hypothetical protein
VRWWPVWRRHKRRDGREAQHRRDVREAQDDIRRRAAEIAAARERVNRFAAEIEAALARRRPR